MNYGSIKLADCANGPGMRTSLFVSGCRHHCKGCFNEPTWPFDYGQEYTKETEDYIISTLGNRRIAGLSILGGEPFEPENQAGIYDLCVKTKKLNKTLWIYTGFVLEDILCNRASRCRTELTENILMMTDVLVDGLFIESQRDISLRFRGSRNQRIIDIPKSLRKGKVVIAEEWM